MDPLAGLSPESEQSQGRSGDPDARGAGRPRDLVGYAVRFSTVGLFSLAAIYAINIAEPVLFPILLATLISIVLSGPVSRLERIGLPRAFAAALVVAAVIAVSVTALGSLIGPAQAWVQRAPTTLNQVERKLRKIKDSVEEVRETAKKVGEVASVSEKPGAANKVEVSAQPAFPDRVMSAIPGLAVSAASTLALLYLILASGDHFFRKLVRCMRGFSERRRIVRIARTAQSDFARYLGTVTQINLALCIVTTVAMYLLGMPNPLLWGVIAGVLNFVPYLGPLTSLVLISLASLLSFEQIGTALLPPAAFMLITIVEGQIIVPMVIGRHFTLHPVMVLIATLIGGYSWGIGGTVIAVPTLMAIKVICDHVQALGPVGEFLSGRHDPVPAFVRAFRASRPDSGPQLIDASGAAISRSRRSPPPANTTGAAERSDR